jgi:uncharacterized protein (UPF0335 family)
MFVDTSRIESLLEQLLDKQDELISRVESLEKTVEQSSSDVSDELKWWGDDPSFAKYVLKAFESLEAVIEEQIGDLNSEISDQFSCLNVEISDLSDK